MDITEMLRREAGVPLSEYRHSLMAAAADEIDRLRALANPPLPNRTEGDNV